MALVRYAARWGYRLYLAVIIGGVAITALSVLFSPLVTAVHTAGFATQVLPSPVRFQTWLSPQPARSITTWQSDDGSRADADVYVIPDGRRRAGLLVVLGANAAGANDPDVVNLGEALARTGFTTMYYWSSRLGTDANIDAAEIDSLVAAFRHLRQQEYVDPDRVGIAGFSVGASLSLVAAADPRIADDVAFVNAFGGYHDAADLLVQIAAGQSLDEPTADEPTADEPTADEPTADEPTADGEANGAWEVDPLTRRVFINEITENILDETRREQLRSRAIAGDPLPDSADFPADAAVLALLNGGLTISEAQGWYAQLPDAYRQQVRAISPSTSVGKIGPETNVLLMHDRADPLIPVGESRRLAAAFHAAGRHDVKYTETDIFRHVRPDAEKDWRSIAKGAAQLFRHMYGIIALAR